MKTPLFLISLLIGSFSTLQGQDVNIPDANFKAALIQAKVDKNNDGIIQESEAADVDSLYLGVKSISSLQGIEAFVNLRELSCGHNQLTILELKNHPKLEELGCNNNKLTSLVVSGAPKLKVLDCFFNKITNLDLSQNKELHTLYCAYNELTELNLKGATKLDYVESQYNQLSHLDVSTNTQLTLLQLNNSKLTSLDVSRNKILNYLYLSDNALSGLDVRANSQLTNVECENNPALSQICLTDAQLKTANSNPKDWTKDASAFWSTTCVLGVEEAETHWKTRTIDKIYNLAGSLVRSKEAESGLLIFLYTDGSREKKWVAAP